MKINCSTAALGAILAVALVMTVAAVPVNAMDGKEAIEKRVALMKGGVLKNYLYAKNFVKDGKGSAAGVAAHAHLLNDAAKQIVALFPKGTGRGDFDDKTTRALPKIWEDWDGFKKAAETLAEESAKLASVAEGGDKGAIAAQFGAVGKNGCGGCHKHYRGAEVK